LADANEFGDLICAEPFPDTTRIIQNRGDELKQLMSTPWAAVRRRRDEDEQ
jgi:hypothetical protein